jgi:hypothetical protein
MYEEGNIYRTGLTGDDCGEQTTLSNFCCFGARAALSLVTMARRLCVVEEPQPYQTKKPSPLARF